MVLEAVQRHVTRGQLGLDGGVPRQGLRFVVVVGEHGVGPQRGGHSQNGARCLGVLHDQVDASDAMRLTQRLQLPGQVHQRFADELHPPVGPGQCVQNGFVQHKQAKHLSAGLQRVVQRRVVVHPQIPTEPHQTGVVLFLHGVMLSRTPGAGVQGAARPAARKIRGCPWTHRPPTSPITF